MAFFSFVYIYYIIKKQKSIGKNRAKAVRDTIERWLWFNQPIGSFFTQHDIEKKETDEPRNNKSNKKKKGDGRCNK